MKKILTNSLPPLFVFAFGIALWDLAVRILHIPPYLVPSPLEVIGAMRDNAALLAGATLLTASSALGGFFLSLFLGALTALAFSQSSTLRKGLYPYAIFLQTVPIVAVAPLIIIWFGTGFASVVLVSFVISLFPVVTNTTTGLMRIDPGLTDLFQFYGATRTQTLFRLKLPNAVPYLVAGARISSGLSVIGAIVGEFSAGYGTSAVGLGYLIVQTKGQLDTDFLFAAVLSSTLLGLAIFAIVNLTADVILSRWYRPV